MRFALDFLAGAKYRKVARVSRPHDWGLGGFATTFGDFMPIARDACVGMAPIIRIQMIWSDSHTFGDKNIPELTNLAKRYNALQKEFPSTNIILSPFCEHNVNNPDRYLNLVQEIADMCQVVNTPWKGAHSSNYPNEVHGPGKPLGGVYDYSFDGGIPDTINKSNSVDIVDADITGLKSRHKECRIFYMWHGRFNLKYGINDTTPRPKRTARPTVKFVRSILYLATDIGHVSLPNKWLCKSHSEMHPPVNGVPDAKGDKLLIIAPVKASQIVLKTQNGLKVGTLNYYGPYSGGGHRYYSKSFGYELGKRAEALGQPHELNVFVNGKKQGSINPGFRTPPR